MGLLAYDRVGRTFYVAEYPDLVAVVSPGGVVGALVPVGSGPFGLAVDGSSGNVYVTNTYSDNVSEISHSTARTVASIHVQKHPKGIAFDAIDGRLFVADSATDRVSVLSVSPLRVIANVSVGAFPIGVTWDPATNQVFVADHGSGSVSILNGTSLSVTANVSVGREPFELAIDNATDDAYVSDEGSNQVSVISASGDRLVATVPVPLGQAIDLQGVAYDVRHHVVWVAGGVTYAVAINTTREVVEDYVFIDPAGAAYDPWNGDVCLTNIANRTFACFVFNRGLWNPNTGVATQSGIATFVESGLPNGTVWTVRFLPANYTGNSTGMSESAWIRFGVFEWSGFARSPYSFNFTVGHVPGYSANRTAGFVSSAGGGVTIRIVFS
jgi:YVTN family beta-propeller protein